MLEACDAAYGMEDDEEEAREEEYLARSSK
jgi:hypothetical protein